MPLSIAEFVTRWKINALSERSGAQSHFIDLCDMLGQPHPAASDSIGERYTFEKSVNKTKGGKGFADVWFDNHFAWEYKGPHKNLQKAYEQLNDYREALNNPPLLVVCDFDHFEVHTNFTSTSKRVYAFNLDDLNRNQVTVTCPLPPLEVLRALFDDYNVLRPERTDAQVTQEAAKLFSRLAERLELEDRNLGATRAQVAHFLMRLLFCLFADSIGLLPDHVFRNLLKGDNRFNTKRFLRQLTQLFQAMSEREGIFGEHAIKYFNGGLFDTASIIQLDQADLGILYEVSKNYNWSHIAPAIFGTLFERSLDKDRRSLIGAHYTSQDDILLLIEPVLMRPLEQRWAEVKQQLLAALELERAQESASNSRQARIRTGLESQNILSKWIEELTSVRVLDPACGSGNFLYVALRRMLDLWLEASKFATAHGISLVLDKMVSPQQLYGIETEFYAHELASIVVWIGFLQWKHENGVHDDREPILQKLTNIEHGDAILRYDADGNPYEPEWPEADFIIGNPPFLGSAQMKRALGDTYCDDLRALYDGRVKGAADLVVYWFEKARSQVEKRRLTRVGLLATQGIRGGANQETLKRIIETGHIYWAISDKNWTLDGATVHVSMIAFSGESDSEENLLDGESVRKIFADLSGKLDTTKTSRLAENVNICFRGTEMHGAFDLSSDTARKMLLAPANVNGRFNSDVVKRYLNATDITTHEQQRYVIDFGTDMSVEQAALYELPFEYIKQHVYPVRSLNRRESRKARWWLHGEPNPGMRAALFGLPRYIATPRVSKHRIFVWISPEKLPDSALCVFSRSDDYFMGVLHALPHELWARKVGTQLREVESGFRYTPKTTFDTFPFPWPPGTEPTEEQDPRVKAIGEAARELITLRDNWLNPSDASEEELKKRTLTNLYNSNPTWLQDAHRNLDEAVFAAYGWPANLSKDEILSRLLALNHQRAAK